MPTGCDHKRVALLHSLVVTPGGPYICSRVFPFVSGTNRQA